jgi:pilus assembly protein Flp/PilA
MKNALTKFLQEEDGVTAIEYGLIAGLVAIAITTALTTLAGDISGLFTVIGNKLAAIK